MRFFFFLTLLGNHSRLSNQVKKKEYSIINMIVLVEEKLCTSVSLC